jgi:cytochrome c-type biogenesis protein CcmH
MSGFVILAALLALVAAAVIVVPLLAPLGAARRSPLAAGIAAALLLAGAGALYLARSNWNWPAQSADSHSNLTELAERVRRTPADRPAWLQLGQAYAQAGQVSLALHAYDRANALAGGKDPDALAGMGEALLLSGEAARQSTASDLLERALAADPHSAKALFYTGLLAMDAGKLQLARERFSALLALDPPEHVRTALTGQIASIDRMLHPPVDVATLIDLQVEVAAALRARLPADGALFVFVRSPQGGPPLAVRRLPATLPVHVQLSSADSMTGPAALSAGQAVQVVARLSAAGRPTASSGDLYGELRYRAGKDGLRQLRIDELTP